MRVRLAIVLCAVLPLAGCALPKFSDLFEFPGGDSDAAATAAPGSVASAAPAPAAPGAPDPFCVSVAQQDAQRNGFDAATQQRMIQRGYQQCVALFRSP